MGKGEKVEMKEWHVPFRLTLEGKLFIQAPDAETARRLADGDEWDDDAFLSCAEHGLDGAGEGDQVSEA
jgi:hypothetical protein